MTKDVNSWILKDWTIYPKLHLVQNHQSEFVMKPRLMKLLEFFLIHANEVVTKEAILEYVWEGRIVTENLITKSISELRKLLEEHFQEDLAIETLRNVGYRFHSKLEILPNTDEKPSINPPQKSTYFSAVWGIVLVFILLAILGFFFLKKGASNIEYYTELERISSLKGQEIAPIVSPDGQNIAFAWRKSTMNPFQIHIKSLSEENPRKLNQDTLLESSPLWLADGNTLLFLRRDKTGKSNLVKKSIIGEDEMVLADLSAYTIHPQMTLLEEDKYLIFSAKTKISAPYQLYIFDLKQTKIEALTNPPVDSYGDIFPALHQEKNHLTFIRAERGNALLSIATPINNVLISIDLNTKKESQNAIISEEIKGLAYHPKLEQHLIWVVQQLGVTQLFGIDTNGQKHFIKTIKGGVAGSGRVGTNGKMYFEYWQSQVNVLAYPLIAPDKLSTESQELLNSTQWDWGLRFAKTSNKIAFLSYRSGFPEIWSATTDAADKASQVTQLKSKMIQSISISPDGEKIAFLRMEDQQSEIYVIQSNGQNLQKISTDGFDYSAPEWSADGAYLYYSSNQSGKWNIWRQNVKETLEEQITFNGGRVAHSHPKYRNELLFIKENTDTIWQFSLIDQQETPVCTTKGLENFSWQPSKEGIYYLAWHGSICRLLYYDFNRQETQVLKSLEHILPNLPALSIAPDGKSLYLAQSNEVNADILALEIDFE